ncbi:uncharacterized protein LOC143223207 [Tachypleus tridentatus]|uniref:uncharacterized protein LOC143223207 n=1 Tax=Tachypleus tridentatus TaxID=6853 RepID=UPI003FD3DBAF
MLVSKFRILRVEMKLLLWAFLLFGGYVGAEERKKRQADFPFPGPRNEGEQRDSGLYQVPQSQFQAQPAQPYSPPRSSPKYDTAPQQSLDGDGGYSNGEDGPTTPDPLAVLLAGSSFSCSGKNEGYYADDSINCRVFHYCVGETSYSWMCPEKTVFHQVHLNCVPSEQDICDRSEKYHIVNDYLYKTIDFEGPNKTARYYQRYYPEEFLLGAPALTEFGFPEAPSSDSGADVSAPASPPRSSSFGGSPASRPASRPRSYDASAPQTRSQSVAYIPSQSSQPRPRAPAPSRQTNYPNLPELPELPQIPDIPQGQPRVQAGGNSGARIPIRYNPNAYRGSTGSLSTSQDQGGAGVLFDDEYN